MRELPPLDWRALILTTSRSIRSPTSSDERRGGRSHTATPIRRAACAVRQLPLPTAARRTKARLQGTCCVNARDTFPYPPPRPVREAGHSTLTRIWTALESVISPLTTHRNPSGLLKSATTTGPPSMHHTPAPREAETVEACLFRGLGTEANPAHTLAKESCARLDPSRLFLRPPAHRSSDGPPDRCASPLRRRLLKPPQAALRLSPR